MKVSRKWNNGKRIAFLAPEIPALSATFVYNEILELERLGMSVVPVSVHTPIELASSSELDMLTQRVQYLYKKTFLRHCCNSFFQLFFAPKSYLKAVKYLFKDILEVGLFTRNSLGLVYRFVVAASLARILRVTRCFHLHVHFAHVPADIAMYASSMTGVKFTVMAHANDIFERGNLLARKSERATKMLTISEFNCTYLKSLGISSDKLGVVRCGVSFPSVVRSNHSDKKSSYRIGTLGRLVEKKGVDDLINAVSMLRCQGVDVKLSLAGDGPLHGQLDTLVDRLNLSDSISFVGSISHDKVAEWMSDLDIFVLACKKDSNGDMDGIPVVLMEAMSQSIPVISTRLSGIPELILDNETGLLAEPSNPADLAYKIQKIIDNPELTEALVENGRDHVVQEFGQSVNINRLKSYF